MTRLALKDQYFGNPEQSEKEKRERKRETRRKGGKKKSSLLPDLGRLRLAINHVGTRQRQEI
jgi:hypothetical protein